MSAERLSESFLKHAVAAPSQYDSTCRTLAAEVLELRAEVERLRAVDRTAPPSGSVAGSAARLLTEQRRLAPPPVVALPVGDPCDHFEPYTGTGLCQACFFPAVRHLAPASLR